MTQRRIFRKRRRWRRGEEEERVNSRSLNRSQDRSGLSFLQQHIGNQAVQRMLMQRQAEGQSEAKPKEPIEVGKVKIEEPEIEYYEVDGNNLPEVSDQILPSGAWYRYQFQLEPKVENGVIMRVDITVRVILQLPEWAGAGWEQASDAEKAQWLGILQSMQGDPKAVEEEGRLPQQWLLGPQWQTTPEETKKSWRNHLQEFQSEEKSYLDITRRRVMVLQQRLFNQPADQMKAIFDQFIKDLKLEQAIYVRQTEAGQPEKISISAEALVQ